MFEELKELKPKDSLTIDDARTRELTGVEDYEIQNVRVYSQEEGEIVFFDLDGFSLVAHTFSGDPRYYVYEQNSEGDMDDLEDDGFRMNFQDEDILPRKVYAGRTDQEVGYKANIGPFASMNVDRNDANVDEGQDVAICEYRGKSKPLTHMVIERIDTTFILYQGFRISEDSIVI